MEIVIALNLDRSNCKTAQYKMAFYDILTTLSQYILLAIEKILSNSNGSDNTLSLKNRFRKQWLLIRFDKVFQMMFISKWFNLSMKILNFRGAKKKFDLRSRKNET